MFTIDHFCSEECLSVLDVSLATMGSSLMPNQYTKLSLSKCLVHLGWNKTIQICEHFYLLKVIFRCRTKCKEQKKSGPCQVWEGKEDFFYRRLIFYVFPCKGHQVFLDCIKWGKNCNSEFRPILKYLSQLCKTIAFSLSLQQSKIKAKRNQ